MRRVLVPYRSEQKVEPYLVALRHAGLEPLPHYVDTAATMGNADALLLTGGTDLDPELYGEKPDPHTNEPDRIRDDSELGLLTEALELDAPVLAICRGVQLLNVHQGGTLIQHLGSHHHDPRLEDRSAPAHQVVVKDDTLLAQAIADNTIGVNSRHHQAIGRPSKSLRVCAVDPEDNVIEAVDLPDKRWVLGVQWHPEDQVHNSKAALQLFEAFARAIGS